MAAPWISCRPKEAIVECQPLRFSLSPDLSKETPMEPTAVHRDDLRHRAREILAAADRVVLDKSDVTALVLATLLARGHVLLEDIPGVGKTTLALTLSALMGLECTRVQFTPDLMPSDVTGFTMYRQDTHTFEYQPGPVFCNLLLADEVNRTSPKTQAALLEVMEERSVTVDGHTRTVPEPFCVIATQNPLGSAGTQPLPFSQLDRFMVSCALGYPSPEAELAMAREDGGSRRTEGLATMADTTIVCAMQASAAQTFAHDAVLSYAVRLMTATRNDERLSAGAGPRGTLALVRLAKASAWLRGSDFVAPADIAEGFEAVARHRVMLSPAAQMSGATVADVLAEIRARVPRPRFAHPNAPR